MAVTVVTDTTQYMPHEVVEDLGVVLISLYVNWADRQVREDEHADF